MKCTLIVNPAAGQRSPGRSVDALRGALERDGHRVEVVVTARRGDAEQAARIAAGSGQGALVVAGGDGTLNEVVNGRLGSAIPVCFVPAGTANVVGLELGLPTDPVAACGLVSRGVIHPIDVGVANGRAFLLACGAGLDAEVVACTSLAIKRRMGRLAYLVAGLRVLARIRPRACELTIDGCARDGLLYQALAANTTRYAGQFRLSGHGAIDDGLLDVYLFHARGRVRLARALLSVMRGGHAPLDDVEHVAARTLECAAREPWPTQIDGDLLGATPVSVHIEPGGLPIYVQPGSP